MSSTASNSGLTYRDAGVDIDAGNELVERIKPAVARTRRPGVMSSLGGFGGLFELPLDRYKKPVLVSGTDGVGTKLRLAIDHQKHQSVGIDLVAMCVNDIIVLGAEPLFFLDYYATGKLSVDTAADVVNGIAKGCELSGAALIGGETAELPGMYEGDDYDLAGFCVGIVDKDNIVDGSRIAPGHQLLGLASSGVHSNGYSLVRRILTDSGLDPQSDFHGKPLLDVLLEPTRIYTRSLLALAEADLLHGAAHITGGGVTENLPRVLPEQCRAVVDPNSWPRSELYQWLQTQGQVADEEMLRTFNCGIGMIVCVPETQAQQARDILEQAGETVYALGHIESGQPSVRYSS